MRFMTVFGVILLITVFDQINASKVCFQSKTCIHNAKEKCGVNKQRKFRWFLDSCDMLEYNCLKDADYEKTSPRNCAHLPSIDSGLPSVREWNATLMIHHTSGDTSDDQDQEDGDSDSSSDQDREDDEEASDDESATSDHQDNEDDEEASDDDNSARDHEDDEEGSNDDNGASDHQDNEGGKRELGDHDASSEDQGLNDDGNGSSDHQDQE